MPMGKLGNYILRSRKVITEIAESQRSTQRCMKSPKNDRFRYTGASTQCRTRVLIGSRGGTTEENQKVLPKDTTEGTELYYGPDIQEAPRGKLR